MFLLIQEEIEILPKVPEPIKKNVKVIFKFTDNNRPKQPFIVKKILGGRMAGGDSVSKVFFILDNK